MLTESLRLEKWTECQLFDEDILVLSLSFSLDDSIMLSATLSSGQVALLKFTDSSLELIGVNDAHSLEAWTSSFGYGQLGAVLFSGGDDAVLAAHDTRLMGMGAEQSMIWSSKRIHSAGVTSILPSSSKWKSRSPLELWTGGYDDHLKSIDLRLVDNTLQSYLLPKVKTEQDLGGGVWRLIPSPIGDDRVLACCMYGGARIVDTEGEVVRTFTKGHASMVYGGDWTADGKTVSTCSFYDNQLQVWSPDDVDVES